MTSEQLLAGLLVATNLFWAYLTMVLINKVMSRNYHEYVVSQAAATPPERFNAQDYPMGDLGAVDGVHVPMG